MKSVIVSLIAGSDQAHSHGEADDLCLVDVTLLLDIFPQVLGPENEPAEEFLHLICSFKLIIIGKSDPPFIAYLAKINLIQIKSIRITN